MRLHSFCFLLIGCFVLLTRYAGAQETRRELTVNRATLPIAIDGVLNEREWVTAASGNSFVQTSPQPGAASSQETDVHLLYDDNYIYVGAILHDRNPDSILKQLTARDNYEYANTDAFVVTFDTYNDHQNGFAFAVTAAGVQADAKIRFDNFDYSWNAAWFSKIVLHDSGWTIEMKIPYAALRFPTTSNQNWGVNFLRTIRRIREKSAWSRIRPEVSNFLSQTGTLAGISNIASPVRLAFLPYLSTYAEDYNGQTAHTLNGGLDVKYGLNESFTLDLTLVPDFGQTLYDNRVLNLSPIEVRYDERRYFFTEGVDLFNKNDLFYSRRVGGTPVNAFNINKEIGANEIVEKNPISTKLYNATKISGRNKKNVGIGFFNAIAAPTYATLRDTLTNAERNVQTAPLTNYNVIVLDQALKNNSYVSFVNTNVYRRENNYNANVSALLVRLVNKQNSYMFSASGDVSNLTWDTATVTGYRYYAEVGKIKGNYTVSLNTRTITDQFNPNDLGYLGRNNVSNTNLSQSYNIYKPFGIANNSFNNITVSYNSIYKPNAFQSLTISESHNITLRSFHSLGVYMNYAPMTSNDYFEPRTPGRKYLLPAYGNGGAYLSSDYRKKFALDVEIATTKWKSVGRRENYISVSPRYRFSDKLLVILSAERNEQNGDVGFVAKSGTDIYLGTRTLTTLITSVDASYIFNNKMSLKINGRHYWSKAVYEKYSLLLPDGNLTASNYNTNHNINFNTFNIFSAFTWQFRPGSEMNIVYQNSIYTQGSQIYHSYTEDLRFTLAAPQSNSLSIKIIYFLDYLSLKKGTF